MSHFTTVKICVKDRAVLKEVLDELNLADKACREIEQKFLHQDSGDLVLRGEYRKSLITMKDKILQQYARKKILKEAQQRNYVLVREKPVKGNKIRLTLRKVA